MRRLGRVAVLLLLVGGVAPATGDEPVLLTWLPENHLVLRFDREHFVTRYDLAVEVLVERLLRGRRPGPPPGVVELREAAARRADRLILTEAARRSGTVVPDEVWVTVTAERLIDRYGGDVTNFEARLGLTVARLRSELIQRSLVRAFLSEVVAPTIRITEADVSHRYHRAATGPVPERLVPELRRLLYFERLATEVARIRERYLGLHELVVVDTDLDPRAAERWRSGGVPLDARRPDAELGVDDRFGEP